MKKVVVPNEIVEKMETVNAYFSEIKNWMEKNIEIDNTAFEWDFIFDFTNTPEGKDIGNGVIIDQYERYEDSYCGSMYIPTEKGNYFEVGIDA